MTCPTNATTVATSSQPVPSHEQAVVCTVSCCVSCTPTHSRGLSQASFGPAHLDDQGCDFPAPVHLDLFPLQRCDALDDVFMGVDRPG